MALTLKKAQRKRVKLKIGLSAPSGGGKTASSLILAYGILKGEHPDWNDSQIWDKIAVVDTENGSGELYSNVKIGTTTIGEYNVIPLDPPYDPLRYVECINACKEAGMEVCICDSLSHAWSGKGGVLEKQGNVAKRTGNTYTSWREVTPLHNQMIDAILQTDMHMICTMRSKTEYVQEKDGNGKTTVRKVGLAPVQREGMEYEFSMFIEIDADHQAYVSKDRTGIVAGEYFTITPEVGIKIAKWLSTGAPEDVKPKVVLEKTVTKSEDEGETLESVISDIDATAKELPSLGIDKANISKAIKDVTGGMANYKNIKDLKTAKLVLSSLKSMKEDLHE